MTNRFEFRDAFGRVVEVTPCWVTSPGAGGAPAVQFRLACGTCLQVPRQILPDVLAGVRETAGQAGPDSPEVARAYASGGVVGRGFFAAAGERSGCGPVLRSGLGRKLLALLDQNTPEQDRNACGTSCSQACSGCSPQISEVEAGPDCGTVLIHPEQIRTRRNTGGTRGSHPAADLPAQCERCLTSTHLMAGGAFAACARVAEPLVQEQPLDLPGRGGPGCVPTGRHEWVKGRCPACHRTSLFLGSGGYVTCSWIECPEPDAASTLLEGTPAGWVRASEALHMVGEADQRVEGMTTRALAARRYAETLPAPVGDKIVALLTGRAPLDPADPGAAVPAQAGDHKVAR